MRDLTGDKRFLQQKELEGRLQRAHPERWLPLYSQVTFSHTPYQDALARGRMQQEAMESVMTDAAKWNHFTDDKWMEAALSALDNLQAAQT